MISHFVTLPALMQSIEALSGLHLCLKTFHRATWRNTLLEEVPTRYELHLTEFCREVKTTRSKQCIQCDLQRIPQIAAKRVQPFVHRCHAGASELIIPLSFRNRLCAIGYLGQFRESESQPLALPLFSAEKIQQFTVLGTLLQRFFLYEGEHALKTSGEASSRQVQIMRFLRKNLKSDPSLTDLADELKVSVSRAGHLVKEETGQTFSALKMQLRIDEAKEMLYGTMLTVENIAGHIGFSDVRYFYRAFRQETGRSPGQWRREANRSALGA